VRASLKRKAIVLAGLVLASIPLGRGAGAKAGRTVVHDARGRILSSSAYPGVLPGFAERFVAPGKAWEPAMAFSKTGHAFYAGVPDPDRRVPVLYPGDLYGSPDGGMTWGEVTPSVGPFPSLEVGWADPWMAADVESGAVYAVNLEPNVNLNCLPIVVTSNDGASWRPNHVCDLAGIGEDYPVVFTGTAPGLLPTDRPPVYVCYNSIAFDPLNPDPQGTQTHCQRSDNGALTFVPITKPFADLPGCQIWQEGAAYYEGLGARHSPFDAIYMAGTLCDVVYVSVSKDYGATWQLVTVNTGDGVSAEDGGVSLAEDAAGDIYCAWLGRDGLPRVAASRDGGLSWSGAIRYAAPGVTWAKYPSVLAGAAGRVAVMYVGSGVPGGLGASKRALASSRWDAYVTMTLNALSSRPVFASAKANPSDDPLRIGDCTGRCEPVSESPVTTIPRDWLGMGDKLVAAMNPLTGAVVLPIVDLCLDACAGGDWNAPPAGRAAVVVQTSGTSLLGRVLG
jgi:hypothetical protein